MRLSTSSTEWATRYDSGEVVTSDAALLQRLRAAILPADASLDTLAGPFSDVQPRLGAVMVLLYPRYGETHLLLEHRPHDLPNHGGQISLPGGGFRPDDGTYLAAAQRETLEELGIAADEYAVWGRLEPVVVAASNFLVIPFVGYAPRQVAPIPDPREVAEALEVPLRVLVDPASMLEEVWELRGTSRRVAYFSHGPHKIWGATARVLGQITAILREGPPPEGALHPGDVVPWP
jgi:8-oxo-dGTP pyrophosphatase MutT (NUDIX family)